MRRCALLAVWALRWIDRWLKMPPSWRGAFLFLGGKKQLGDGFFPLMSPTTSPPRGVSAALLVTVVFQKMASSLGLRVQKDC